MLVRCIKYCVILLIYRGNGEAIARAENDHVLKPLVGADGLEEDWGFELLYECNIY